VREPTGQSNPHGQSNPQGRSNGTAGTSEADLVGLMAIGTQFGLAGVQAADATVQLGTGPVRSPGMLLALAMAGEQGLAVLAQMQEVALTQWDDSMARAALDVGIDAMTLGASATRFMLADDGFFTDPLTTVPLSRAEGQEVVRKVTFTIEGDVTYKGLNVAGGGAIVVEYLANGLVKVSLRGNVRLGGELASTGAGGISAGAGPLGGVSWLMANERDASRLVALLTVAGGASAASGTPLPMSLALSGALPQIPRPQTVTVGQGGALKGSLDAGPVSLGEAEVKAGGQVTIDEDGNRAYEIKLEGQASTSLAGPILDHLPADVRAQLPGGDTWADPNVFEASGEAALEVKTDAENNVESVTVTLGGSAGTGSGLSTAAASAQSTAGEKVEVKVELDAEELKALGPKGAQVLAHLEQNRPDLAARALGDLGSAIADQAGDPQRSRYTTVKGGGGVERGVAGASGGGSVTIESSE
jgi:hypothetical protein